MKSSLRISLSAICPAVVGAILATSALAEPAPFMMRAVVAGRTIEGQPLLWNQQNMLLMGRDGVLHEFAPADAKEAVKFGRGFVGYTSAEMTALLRGEFDRSFDIATTPHYAVVHPRGAWREWAERLESLYGSFTHYMSVRGFNVTQPATPLVAIVFRNQADYFKHTAANGTQLQEGTMGHYDPASNRVYMFDAGESGDGADWGANAETLIHEATHQTAFNVGVHRRLTEQPRWAVEGLAMTFEAPGVWDASAVRQPSERINRARLDYFRRLADERSSDWLVQLVASDSRFQTDALSAYAESWTLTFYLCETRPQDYSGYLARVASRGTFTQYPPMERVRDFTDAFGGDVELLMAQVERFVEELP